jgi:hypothetical protein
MAKKKRKPNQIVLTFDLTPDICIQLDEFAAKQGMTRDQFARMVLERVVDEVAATLGLSRQELADLAVAKAFKLGRQMRRTGNGEGEGN